MKVLCNNSKCLNFKELETSREFKINRNFNPIIKNIGCGECKLKHPEIFLESFQSKTYNTFQPVCSETEGKCENIECPFNKDFFCTRDEIFVNKSLVSQYFVCNCASNKKIHRMSLMSNLNSDGTPKGGNIDDAYSEKLYADSLKYKMFPDGRHRDSKERPKKV